MYEVQTTSFSKVVLDKIFNKWYDEGYKYYYPRHYNLTVVYPDWLKTNFGIESSIAIVDTKVVSMWGFPSEEDYAWFVLQWS